MDHSTASCLFPVSFGLDRADWRSLMGPLSGRNLYDTLFIYWFTVRLYVEVLDNPALEFFIFQSSCALCFQINWPIKSCNLLSCFKKGGLQVITIRQGEERCRSRAPSKIFSSTCTSCLYVVAGYEYRMGVSSKELSNPNSSCGI